MIKKSYIARQSPKGLQFLQYKENKKSNTKTASSQYYVKTV